MVGLHVHGEVPLAAEELVADAALVGGLLVGGPEVEAEVVLRSKLHAARLALKLTILTPRIQRINTFKGTYQNIRA